MKWNIKRKLICIFSLLLVIGIMGTSLSQKVVYRSESLIELRGLATTTVNDTMSIINNHKNDFNYNNFKQKIKNEND